jgi:putative ABC transport system substrate-binding protein
MRRREFIAGLAGAAAWPVAARAQQAERIRRVGVLMNLAADDPEALLRVRLVEQGLQGLRWTIGRNLQVDYRWGAGDAEQYRRYAAELVMLMPDVLLAAGAPAVEALQRATRTLPIVFLIVTDPVGGGLVASLAHPGGNTTGFTLSDYRLSGKWLELLKQIAPGITRAAVLRDPVAVGIGQFAAIQAVASSLHVEVSAIDVRDPGEIERAVTAFARQPNGGLIVTASAQASIHRGLITSLAARYKLPAIYSNRVSVADGGLIAYGVDGAEQFPLAAGYVDRILKGEKPGDLPVQEPVKFQTVINLKTAKALGITIPETLLATADEVIQ